MRMEARKIDLMELSEPERKKVLKQARSYLKRQKDETKILKKRLASLRFRFAIFWHSRGQAN